jgi:transposase
MQVLKFKNIVRTERAALQYMLECCERVDRIRCRQCGSEKVYLIEGGKRRRCARCGHSFHPFQARYLNEVKIGAQKWLWIIKLFELDNSTWTIGKETGISYPTVLKAVNTIRSAIADGAAVDRVFESEGVFPAADLLFGVLRGGHAAVQVLETVPAKTLRLSLNLAGGRMIFLDREARYRILVCGNRELPLVDRGERYPHFKVYSSGMPGFWQYAQERLVKHGVSRARIKLHIKEMEFRYIHRREQLFDILVERLCHYIPS